MNIENIENMEFAVFDIDHSLININTNYEFASEFLREVSPVRCWIFNVCSYEPLRKGLSFFVGDDVRRKLSAFLFKPYPKNMLKKYARVMFEHNFDQWVNRDVMRLVDISRTLGMRVVLASATLDFIADALADMLGIEAISSIYMDGHIATDVKGRKHELLKRRYPGAKCRLFVSDNVEDISMDPEVFVFIAAGRFFVRTEAERLTGVLGRGSE